jgi:hypothetical protein
MDRLHSCKMSFQFCHSTAQSPLWTLHVLFMSCNLMFSIEIVVWRQTAWGSCEMWLVCVCVWGGDVGQCSDLCIVRLKVLAVVLLKVWVFYDVMLCHWVCSFWHSGGAHCLHFQGQPLSWAAWSCTWRQTDTSGHWDLLTPPAPHHIAGDFNLLLLRSSYFSFSCPMKINTLYFLISH